jgi:hypothetical protein
MSGTSLSKRRARSRKFSCPDTWDDESVTMTKEAITSRLHGDASLVIAYL